MLGTFVGHAVGAGKPEMAGVWTQVNVGVGVGGCPLFVFECKVVDEMPPSMAAAHT